MSRKSRPEVRAFPYDGYWKYDIKVPDGAWTGRIHNLQARHVLERCGLSADAAGNHLKHARRRFRQLVGGDAGVAEHVLKNQQRADAHDDQEDP